MNSFFSMGLLVNRMPVFDAGISSNSVPEFLFPQAENNTAAIKMVMPEKEMFLLWFMQIKASGCFIKMVKG